MNLISYNFVGVMIGSIIVLLVGYCFVRVLFMVLFSCVWILIVTLKHFKHFLIQVKSFTLFGLEVCCLIWRI